MAETRSLPPPEPTWLDRAPVALPPPIPGRVPPPGGARSPRPHRHRTVAIVVAAVLGSLALLGILLVGADEVLTHDLLAADFETGSAPFVSGENSSYRLGVVDGAYRITAMPTVAADVPPAVSFAAFVRTAYTADVETTLVAVVDPTAAVEVGVACYDLPRTNGHGYELRLAPGRVQLVKHDGEAAWTLADAATSTAWPPAGATLRLSCYVSGTTVELHGYVDGVEVAGATDPSGFTQYQHMALVFRGPAGTSAAFDDVRATVPGG